MQLNHHPLQRPRDLLGLMRVTVFAPDDLQLVKGGPAGRRDYLDDLLVAIAPRYEAVRADYERVLRNATRCCAAGCAATTPSSTLEVFDLQLAAAGRGAGAGPARSCSSGWSRRSPRPTPSSPARAPPITTRLRGRVGRRRGSTAPLDPALLDAFAARRQAEVDRGITLAGPHRDEWRLLVGGLESRTHASQGEQRTLALALRLGGHRLCTEVTGSAPVLLLDDVFSELDDQRAVALVAHLDAGQTLVTTAGTGAARHLRPIRCCASTPAGSRRRRERERPGRRRR